MNRYARLKTIIAVLSLLVIFESFLLFRLIPARPKKVALVKGKIAIVIDDWGYNINNLSFIEEIGYSVTISVLPNLNFSRRVAEEANNKGFEIIMHLPLEPLPSERMRLERNTIMTQMGAARIKEIFLLDLNSIPYIRGTSNHMGSKATQDPLVMETLFTEMRKKDLYFLDSLVSGKSVCENLAQNMMVRFAKRDVFLDNENNSAYIKGQIYKLKLKARRQGFAVGIGHDRKITLAVLKEVMPALEKEGYKFVFVSELAQ